MCLKLPKLGGLGPIPMLINSIPIISRAILSRAEGGDIGDTIKP